MDNAQREREVSLSHVAVYLPRPAYQLDNSKEIYRSATVAIIATKQYYSLNGHTCHVRCALVVWRQWQWQAAAPGPRRGLPPPPISEITALTGGPRFVEIAGGCYCAGCGMRVRVRSYGCMEHALPSLGAGLAHSILLQSGRRFDFSG